MSDTAVKQEPAARRSVEWWIRSARLTSGLVIMAFVILHFANHMLLLVSLDAAEKARFAFMALWRNPLGTLLFYGALVTHVALTLLALYRRRTLRMSGREALQLSVGLIIPLLIVEHIVGTRIAHALTGVDDSYAYVVNSLWIDSPRSGARQALAVLAVWLHGCLGVFFWLRYRRWFPRAAPFLLVFAALVPVLVLLGFVQAGRSVAVHPYVPPPVDAAVLAEAAETRLSVALSIYGVYGAALALVLAARAVRARRMRRAVVEVRYASGRTVRVPQGYSVLEASRLGGIPHHSVCGGRGRCSTCRVKVLSSLDALPAAEAPETATLRRIHAAPDVRLACQLRPRADVSVALLLDTRDWAGRTVPAATTAGREQEVAILFCDIRSFTALSSRRLPFDTVFLLNRYFAAVGQAVERAGGRLDKFIGDGAMAIFGLDVPKAEACRQAVSAAAEILAALARLSDELAEELGEPLRVAIGIHAGPAIVGTMGYGRVAGVTAIGDTVNVASRLEAVAKEQDAAIAVSAAAAALSGFDFGAYDARMVDIRGASGPLAVFIVPQGADFEPSPLPRAANAA